MIRFYLLLVLVLIGFIAWRKPLVFKFDWGLLYRKTTLVVLCCAVLLLGITGHFAWLTALFGVVVAFVFRTLPLILRYAPQLHRFWQSFKATKSHQSASGRFDATQQSKMTVAEAYKILGLRPPVERQDVVLAHKKLMLKMHPDRGGSDYLASQINLAKDLLLKN